MALCLTTNKGIFLNTPITKKGISCFYTSTKLGGSLLRGSLMQLIESWLISTAFLLIVLMFCYPQVFGVHFTPTTTDIDETMGSWLLNFATCSSRLPLVMLKMAWTSLPLWTAPLSPPLYSRVDHDIGEQVIAPRNESRILRDSNQQHVTSGC